MDVICEQADECRDKGIDCGHMDLHTFGLDCYGTCWEATGMTIECVAMNTEDEMLKELNFDD
ncbi:MAG: hypothetical protein JRF53_00665 [Deltaproteobacteria bacterium]|nr:hypothetical protein [Deltaproteobacteria bacterium]